MSIYMRPFKKEDLSAFDPIEPLTSIEINDMELAQAIEDSGLAVTGIRKGVVIVCGGVHPIDDITGEVWIRLSKECVGFQIEMVRLLKSGFKIMEETYPFEILTATVKGCFGTSVSLIERFGFIKQTEEDGWSTYTKRTKYEQPCLTA